MQFVVMTTAIDWMHALQGPWINRQALHAASLRLQHPITGQAFQLLGEVIPRTLCTQHE